MTSVLPGLAVLSAFASIAVAQTAAIPPLRAPAYPLVTHNPYFSTWSSGDRLTDRWPQHWTGGITGVCGMARINGKNVRWCGPTPAQAEAMEQVSVQVTATTTRYTFASGGVKLTASWVSPVIAADADLASFPLTYLSLQAVATDGKEHSVALYVDSSAEWCVHSPDQQVTWSRFNLPGLSLLSFASVDQRVLGRAGDGTRIDWGRFYLGADDAPGLAVSINAHDRSRDAFMTTGRVSAGDDLRQPRPASDDWPVLAASMDLGNVGATPVSRCVYFAYDDRDVVEYFGRKLRPYWARSGTEFADRLSDAAHKRDEVLGKCAEFDARLGADLRAAGGEKYARLCELAYRQTMAAHVIAADFDGAMLMFPKENTSNGCIATVDVFFPSAPFFLYQNPQLLIAQLRPILEYSASPRWKFPFAPHDLGTYPLANGQVYGGGEKTEDNQMPVEESANMLILVEAIAHAGGGTELAAKYWPQLSQWANYLRDHGLDPANQLCTDDFAGHLARNANLAIKAIVGLGCYARLAERLGKTDEARTCREIAERYAVEWGRLAADGDHTVLAYGKPGTWSLKYNLVWDRLLGLNLFPPQLASSEVAYYKSRLNEFGVPLDSRETYTKLDFLAWAAALTPQRADFEALIDPAYAFANRTPDRVGLTDWYDTKSARTKGMHSRSVVGGIYAWMLNPQSKAK